MTGADVIAAARKVAKFEKVSVPEWGIDVHVRRMTAGERDQFEGEQTQARGNSKYRNFRARLVVRCVVDEQGKRLFGDDQVGEVSELDAAGVDRIFDAICRLNRLMKEDVEDLEKNSG